LLKTAATPYQKCNKGTNGDIYSYPPRAYKKLLEANKEAKRVVTCYYQAIQTDNFNDPQYRKRWEYILDGNSLPLRELFKELLRKLLNYRETSCAAISDKLVAQQAGKPLHEAVLVAGRSTIKEHRQTRFRSYSSTPETKDESVKKDCDILIAKAILIAKERLIAEERLSIMHQCVPRPPGQSGTNG
jgi:hypothetical protein